MNRRDPRSPQHAFIVLFVLLLSGNPSVFALAGGMDVVLGIGALVMGALVITKNVRLFTRRATTVYVGFFIILVIHVFEFRLFPLMTMLGFGTRLFIGAALVALVPDLPSAYVRAMVWITTYALVIYSVDQVCLGLNIPFRDAFLPLETAVGIDADHRFSLIYTFTEYQGTFRNAAFFREPGLFAGYVLLGLLFLSLRFKEFPRHTARMYMGILLLGLLSSFSTAGYVTVPFVLAAMAYRYRDQKQSRVPTKSRTRLFVALLLMSVLALWVISANTSFLQEKVLTQYQDLLDEKRNFEITRFGAAMIDIQAIQRRPVFGWGIAESTKFAGAEEFLDLGLTPSGGFTGWVRSFGLVGLFLFIRFIWLSCTGVLGQRGFGAAYVTGVLLVIMQPNTFLNYPMFMSLLFIPAAPPLFKRSRRVLETSPVRLQSGAVHRSRPYSVTR